MTEPRSTSPLDQALAATATANGNRPQVVEAGVGNGVRLLGPATAPLPTVPPPPTAVQVTTPAPAGTADPATPDAIISIQHVTKRFGSHTVLQDVSFDVPRGRTTAVLGPSGTGKSVLLKVIIGLLRPEEGQILVDGEPIVGVREKDVFRIRRKFGVLFQDGALFGSMPLYDNIAFPLREHTRKTEREIRTTVLQKAELVGLVAHLHKLPGEVSGGMRKRAGLARALVLDPEIILFDEPDSGLDPVRVAYLDDLVNTAQRETGATFFIITHNIESVMRTAHYMGLLFRSRLVAFDAKEKMVASDNPIVRQFLAGKADGPIGMDEMADADAPVNVAGSTVTDAAAAEG
jgi:phospholipid/cholesterol/gamma-HCH transport system ATP-binding protein